MSIYDIKNNKGRDGRWCRLFCRSFVGAAAFRKRWILGPAEDASAGEEAECRTVCTMANCSPRPRMGFMGGWDAVLGIHYYLKGVVGSLSRLADLIVAPRPCLAGHGYFVTLCRCFLALQTGSILTWTPQICSQKEISIVLFL
jgi:hypothetical protein